MKKKEIFELYEKLYFHEIDVREKLNSRLQTPLTLMISLIGVLAFILQNYDHHGFTITSTIFSGLILFSALSLITSVCFFILSWYNNVYSFLPSAKETNEYHAKLKQLYKPYKNRVFLTSKYFEEYLFKYYIDCSSINTACNDMRSVFLHKTNTCIIAAALLIFSAFLVFYLGGLDGSRIKAPSQVILQNPVKVIIDPTSLHPKD